MSSSPVAISAHALHVGYARPVVGPIDLTVRYGERVGIFGANGIGKSTLLRAVLGSARVHAGTLRTDTGLIGSVRQNQVLLPHMPWTAGEFIDWCDAQRTGLPNALSNTLSVRVDRLSGGQRQLLELWSVLTGPARLIMLDEPTSYLDPPTTETLVQLLNEHTEDKALLIVSHDRKFLDDVCTQITQVTRSTSPTTLS